MTGACPVCDRRPGLDSQGRLAEHQRHMFTRTRCLGSNQRPAHAEALALDLGRGRIYG